MLQGGGACLCTMIHWALLSMEFLLFLWDHCHPGVIMFVLCLARRYKFLLHIYLLPLAGAVSSRMVPYPFVALVSVTLSPREERQLKIVGWCVVVTTAILVDKGSCQHKCVGGGPWRRLADPLSTIPVASLCVPSARARPQVLPKTEKAASVKCLDAVWG